MIKNILVGMMLGITLVGSVAAEDAPTTLSNSGTISPYKPERGGIFLAPDLLLVIPGNTKLDISTQPWVDSSNNTIVISKMPYVSGTKYAKDYAKEGSVFTYTTDERYRYFKGNGLPSTPMGEYPVQKGTEAYKYYSVAPGGHDFRTGIPGSDYSSAAAIGISPYNLTVQLPKYPKPSATPNPIASLPIGVTLTGTVWHFELANASGTAWYNPTSLLPIDNAGDILMLNNITCMVIHGSVSPIKEQKDIHPCLVMHLMDLESMVLGAMMAKWLPMLNWMNAMVTLIQ